jgi:heat shock protein HtpX
MIPSSWYRRLVIALLVLEVAGALMWLATRLAPESERGLAQTLAGMVFLMGFYSAAPLSARFLAPRETKDQAMKDRLSRVMAGMPRRRPVFLYDHTEQNANTVGLTAGHSRVYVTTGLMALLSDEGLRGILAHEDTHVEEHHILAVLAYACSYSLVVHLADDPLLFYFGFLAFMTLRRHLEYRADAGAAQLVGTAAIVTGLKELATVYQTKRSSRWFVFAMSYPTLPMRIKALETGRQSLF